MYLPKCQEQAQQKSVRNYVACVIGEFNTLQQHVYAISKEEQEYITEVVRQKPTCINDMNLSPSPSQMELYMLIPVLALSSM